MFQEIPYYEIDITPIRREILRPLKKGDWVTLDPNITPPDVYTYRFFKVAAILPCLPELEEPGKEDIVLSVDGKQMLVVSRICCIRETYESQKKSINYICQECGTELLKLNNNKCKQRNISTWYPGACDICEQEKPITKARDFGYPKTK